ncbi:MAG: DCC1-like thiol-disulfide oxidoreductase family protein [Bacteroidota bacterium]
MRPLPDKLILIDGQCNFCHGTVKWVEKYSRVKDFYYSNVQSELGQEILHHYQIPATVDSILYLEKGQLYYWSAAPLKIARHLRFPFNLLGLLLIIPRSIRDWGYRFIAGRRYRWFGKKEVCEMPEVGFKNRVLG